MPKTMDIEISTLKPVVFPLPLTTLVTEYQIAESGKRQQKLVKNLEIDFYLFRIIWLFAVPAFAFIGTMMLMAILTTVIDLTGMSTGMFFGSCALSPMIVLLIAGAFVAKKWSVLNQMRKQSRTVEEQEVFDNHWVQFVVEAQEVISRYNDRIARWNAIAEAIERGVIEMTPANLGEFEGLQNNRESVQLLAHAAEFAGKWYKVGTPEEGVEDMQAVMDRLRNAQARIESFLEVDPDHGIQLGQLREMSQAPVSEAEFKRQASRAFATKQGAGH